MTTRAKLTLYSALATTLVTFCLIPLVQPSGWIGEAFVMIAAVGAAGAGLRRLSVARALQASLQLLVTLYVLLLLTVQSSMDYAVLPGPRALDAVGTLIASGNEDIQQYTIPAPDSPGITLILVGSVTLIAVLVDTLAVTFRKAALAGLPLLTLYSVGTGIGTTDAAWLWFLLAALGYLLLLNAEGQDRLSRWGRVFHGTAQDGSGGLSQSGHRIGLLALAVAVAVPLLVPYSDLGLIDRGDGDGLGNGTGRQVTSLSPVVALTANLNRQDNVEMLRYSTDSLQGNQLYLRIGALDSFDGVQWKVSEQHLQPIPNPMPPAQGLGQDVTSTSFLTSIKISDKLSTEWLPMPYPAQSVSVRGNWRYEPSTRTVVGDRGQKSDGIGYDVTSLELEPSPAQLRAAGTTPADLAKRYTALPDTLPPVVAETARKVVAGKTTPYDQAVALQNWFTSKEFTYSLKVDAGTGNEAITKFLQNKTGFCVHFAASMAAMARSLGIPARVAIGFAPGADQGRGNFIVRSQDYHAWPELYFPGSGWLRFEPTPSRGSTPGYTSEKVTQPTAAPTAQPSVQADPGASAAPSAGSTCTGQQQRQDACDDGADVTFKPEQPLPWWLSWPALTGLLAVLVVLALLATPMLWRIGQRRRRLGGGRHLAGSPELTDHQVLAAWEELIDTAWDLGIPPDDSYSPRGTAHRIAEAGRLDAPAAAAAGRVALATERVLYARTAAPELPLGPDVRTAAEGLRAAAGRRGRARAVLLPASAARLRRRIADRRLAVQDAVRERTGRVFAPVRRLAGLLRRNKS
ncbi:transglutaminase family protein [Kitasatospora sp. P5_F3]